MENMEEVKIGDSIAWRWGSGIAEGIVIKVVFDRLEIETKNKIIVRNGNEQNPALLIEHSSGSMVLKLQSEVNKTTQ